MDLGQILDGESQNHLEGEEHTQPEQLSLVESEATTEEKGEQSAPETPSTEDKAPDPEKSETNDGEELPRDVAGLQAGITAERKKRQAAAQRAAELEQQIAQLNGQLSVYQQQGQPQAKQPEQDELNDDAFWESPQSYLKSLREADRKETQKQLGSMRIELSREVMRSLHDDYDETEKFFIEAAKDNPALIAELNASPNPAMVAYRYGKTMQEFENTGSPEEYRKKVEAEVRAELEAEYRKKGALDAAGKASTSSAAARGSGASTSPVFAGPTPLDQLFKGPGA